MKKGLKLFTTGFICMSAFVFNVKADEVSTEEQLNKCVAKESAVCTITSEIPLTKNVYVKTGSDIVVDLNGNKIIGPDDGKANWYAFIVDGGKLTLKDTSEEQTGEIWAKCYGIETKTGTFVMESGKITATNNKTLGAAIVNYGGKAEIKGGTLVSASQWAANAQSYFSDSELVISGGTFEVASETNATIQVGGQYTKNKETVTITGGTFKGKNAFAVSEKANATISITGGKFTTDISEYVTTGYKVEKDNDENYVVSAIVYEITKGEDQEVLLNESNEITITIDADFNKFSELYINDKLVDKKYYTAKSGSTIITLKSDFVKTLDAGNYEIKATFTDGGTATTNFKLLANDTTDNKQNEVKNPKTSDNIMIYFIISIISVLGLMFIVNKKQTNN